MRTEAVPYSGSVWSLDISSNLNRCGRLLASYQRGGIGRTAPINIYPARLPPESDNDQTILTRINYCVQREPAVLLRCQPTGAGGAGVGAMALSPCQVYTYLLTYLLKYSFFTSLNTKLKTHFSVNPFRHRPLISHHRHSGLTSSANETISVSTLLIGFSSWFDAVD